MTFRVIEGGGRPEQPKAGSVPEARAEIIDRVASAIWSRQDTHPDPAYATWAEMKKIAALDPKRGSMVKVTIAQARAAIGAMTTASPAIAECLILRDIGLDHEGRANALAVIDDYVLGVLR